MLAQNAKQVMTALFKQVPVLAMVHQLQFNYGVIRLDKSLTLANAHYLKDYRTSKSTDSLIEDLLDEISENFQRFSRSKYQEAFSYLLANLFYASSHNKGVLYDRAKNKRSVIQLAIIKFLSTNNLVADSHQPPNMSSNCSYMIAMPELTNRLNAHKAIIANGKKEFKPLLLRDEQKKELSTLKLERNQKGKYKALIKGVELHNAYWENNAVTVSKKIVVPFLHRVFNLNFELGGRFYGHHQELPSNDRKLLLFNGKPTAELDYSSLHIAILYAWQGVEMIGDPYKFKINDTGEYYDRNAVKGIFLRLVNVKSLMLLESVITLSSKPYNKAKYKEYKKARKIFDIATGKGLAAKQPKPPYFKDFFIKNIPDDFNAKQFIIDLKQRHPAIAKLLGGENIGLKLQRADSELMNNVIVDLYDRKFPVPCLPVHDSLVCRQSNSELIRLTMQHHFKQMFGARIAIKEA